MAACIAARKFLYSLPTPAVEQQCFPALLPALCFNRSIASSLSMLYVCLVKIVRAKRHFALVSSEM